MSQQKISGKSCRGFWAMCALVAFGASVCATPSQANRKDFVFAKEWKQPSKGERELELYTTYSNAKLTQAVELDYGVTERFSVAPYVVFERERGESLKYKEFKLEARYQLTKYKTGKFLPAIYGEYIKEKGGPSELEGIFILSRYGKKGDNLSLNFVAERELEDGAETETKYAVAYARPLGKSGSRIGLEWVQSLEAEKNIKFGPTTAFAASDDIWIVAGYAFGLNNRGNNNDTIRLLAEYEF